MTRISSHIDIDTPPAQVWDVLADLGGIYKWNPGVKHSHATSEQGRGEGATRHCDLRPAGRLEERAFDWREGEGFKIDVYESNLPLQRNIVEFTVQPREGGTRVTLAADYQLKFGPIGALLDALFGRNQLRKGFQNLLAGLKYHVETGEVVDGKAPAFA